MFPTLSVLVAALGMLGLCMVIGDSASEDPPRPAVQVRGIYGGVPEEIFARGETLRDYGVNAVWIGSGGLNATGIARLRQAGARVFAEFNTLHEAGYLKE